MASRVEFMPQGMGEEPQQPEQAEQPDSPEQASEMASGQTSGQTGLTDGSGNTNANDGNSSGGKQPSKEEKEAMREYQKLQKMEVAKVEASGGSESASGTEESEAVEPDLYYYHTDHLGSTTFITDRNGDIAQYLAYIPYGETFIEERNVAPYKFNGKELDAETGLYYYGARYYDPSTALWFGTDPLADINPQNSPYVYCKSNPIIRIDPDGMKDYAVNDMDGSTWHNFDTNNDAIILDEVTKVKPHVDQEYGQTVTGGYDGKGSDATSRFHGPSIDASDLGYSFDGWGSRGMEYGYNLLQRFRDLFEMVNGGVNVKGNENPQIMKNESSVHNNHEDVNYYPVIQGAFNDHGVIRTKNFRNHHGDIVSEGDTAGCRIVTTKRNRSSNYIYKKDTVIYMSPKESREFFKANKIK